jgi:hypothetical protein
MRPVLVATLIGSTSTACTYITRATYEAKQETLDEDGDGAPFGGPDKDCDDNNPKVAPGLDEIPYDGLDNDCIGGDVVDADGDGFPGISLEDWQATKPPDWVTWPASVVDDPALVDCVDDPQSETFANAAQIFPGNTNDVPYDGVDSNCDQINDFDADRDGYMPDEIVLPGGEIIQTEGAYTTFVTDWGYDLGSATYGDCDDFDLGVSPAIDPAQDVWYDGIDHDCDGRNDFDKDQDGFMPGTEDEAENEFVAAYEEYVEQYWGRNDPPWGAPQWGDCLDDSAPGISAAPADVYPGAAEIFYDGVDSDCAADNDFDQDADLYMPDGYEGEFNDYLATWNYSYPEHEGLDGPLWGDCADTDPNTNPVALERIGDGADQDCVNGKDAARFGFSNMFWTSPRQPAIVRNERHYVISSSGDWVWLGTTGNTQAAVALFFDFEAGQAAPPALPPMVWRGTSTTFPLGPEVEMVSDGEVAWAATTYENAGQINLIAQELDYDTVALEYVEGLFRFAGTTFTYTVGDIDMVIDDHENVWMIGCGKNAVGEDSTLHVFEGTGATPAPAQLAPAVTGDLCFFHDQPSSLADIDLCTVDGDCETYEFDPVFKTLELVDDNPWPGDGPFLTADFEGEWHVMTGNPDGAWLYGPSQSYHDLFVGLEVLSIDITQHDGDLYIAAVVDDGSGPALELHYGDPDAGLTLVPLQMVRDGETLEPSGATIYADNDRLIIAASGLSTSEAEENDGVGWMFLGW